MAMTEEHCLLGLTPGTSKTAFGDLLPPSSGLKCKPSKKTAEADSNLSPDVFQTFHPILLVSRLIYSSILNIEAIYSSETSGCLKLHGFTTQKAITFTAL
jgi:hypothetical protein